MVGLTQTYRLWHVSRPIQRSSYFSHYEGILLDTCHVITSRAINSQICRSFDYLVVERLNQKKWRIFWERVYKESIERDERVDQIMSHFLAMTTSRTKVHPLTEENCILSHITSGIMNLQCYYRVSQ